jgi:DNA polymerase-3 subunit gamma/tau
VSTALYRRYRPESFAEVIGQEHVTVPLSAALDKDRVNHAYLFSGPRGCGKTTSARILARCLNCAQGPTSTPCGVCDSCVDLARGGGGSLDVVEIDAASHGGVDDARSLRERAVFAPARDRYKVFIIDEAHMVSTQGFNALLKIVEEPPPHVRFVFATTEPEKVIGTIRSRTHHYPFRLVPPERLQAYLSELCEREGVQVGQGVLPLVVRAGAGSVRDSLSVLDQLMAGAGAGGLEYSTAVALLGYTDGALLDDVVDALAAADGATVFRVVDRVIESGHDPRRFVEDLLERLRDLLVVAAVPDGGHAVFRAAPADQLERMRGQAARFGRAELSRAADVVNAALTEMTGATSPRLQLELLCARLLLPAADDGERGVRARVDRIERRLEMTSPAGERGAAPSRPPAPDADSAGRSAAPPPPRAATAVAAPASSAAPPRPTGPESPAPESDAPQSPAPGPVVAEPAPTPATAPSPVPTAPAVEVPAVAEVGPGAGGTEAVRRMWPDVMARLSQLKRTTWSLVSHYAQVLDYDGTRLLLQFDSPGRAGSFGKGAHQEFLRQALIDVMGIDCRFDATAQGSGNGASGAHPTPPAPAPRPDPAAPRPAPADHGARAESSQPDAPAGPEPARSQPARSDDARREPARGPARLRSAEPPSDDIPLPPEPPPDDLPPEDASSSRRRPPPAERPAPSATPPAPSAAAVTRSEPAVTSIVLPPGPSVRPADDVPSHDDPDLEGSNLVGATVVEQLLGGRVIEDRQD